jgi:hypothetical protein
MQHSRPRLRLLLAAALAGSAVTTLIAAHPSPAAMSWSRGDDVALATAWAVALGASAWLFAGSVACIVALGLRRPHLARMLARALPPALRRAVDVAIVASCLAVSAAPAHAANDGSGLVVDQPVVRGSRAAAIPPASARPRVPRSTQPRTTLPSAASRSTSPHAEHAAPTDSGGPARSAPVSPSSKPAPPTLTRSVVVRPGDNLWSIARTEVVRASAVHGDDAIARYWRLVIAANRATLRSGDPSLILPGELVTLPPVPDVS